MTQVTSVEQLTALEDGGQVTVRSRALGNRRWVKDSSGSFAREGAVVDATFFVGYISEGRVVLSDDTPARPGDWFSHGQSDYFMLHEGSDPGTTIYGISFSDGIFRTEHEWRADQFGGERSRITRVEGIPARVQQNYDSVKRLQEAIMDRLNSVSGQLIAAQEQVREKPAPPPPAQVRCVVTVTVHGRSVVDPVTARNVLGLPRNAAVETASDWNYEYQFASLVPPGACACDTVDRARVEATLPPNTQEWDFTSRCNNDEGNDEEPTVVFQ